MTKEKKVTMEKVNAENAKALLESVNLAGADAYIIVTVHDDDKGRVDCKLLINANRNHVCSAATALLRVAAKFPESKQLAAGLEGVASVVEAIVGAELRGFKKTKRTKDKKKKKS